MSYSGRKYRCVITDAQGNTVTSDAAMLTVSTLAISQQPEDATVPVGQYATFTVAAEGEGLTYQWQTQLAGKTTWSDTRFSGYNTDTLSFKALKSYDGRKYRCVVTDENGQTVESEAALLTVTDLIIDGDFTFKINEDNTGVIVIAYSGNSAELIVPDKFNNLPIVAIGESAFEGNTQLCSIDLPDTIVVIGKRAFANCTNLSEMH